MDHKSGFLKLLVFAEIALIVGILVVIVLGGGAKKIHHKGNATKDNRTEVVNPNENWGTESEINESTDNVAESEVNISDIEFSPEVNEKLSAMTTEQKVAQLFVTSPEALTDNDQVTLARDGTRLALEEYWVAGLVYGDINFLGKTQTKELLNNTQNYATEIQGMPMFLFAQEYGGENHSPMATKLDYAMMQTPLQLSEGDAAQASEQGKQIGAYLKDEGINFVLAPCADLSAGVDAGYDEVTFGSDSAKAASMISESVSGYHESQVMTASGTFPGKSYGDSVTLELESWSASNKLVYDAAVNGQTEAIVVGNNTFPALTGNGDTPCSQSAKVGEYLRNDMNYTGMLMTDELSGESAVAAVNAGMNLIYCRDSFKDTYQTVLEAVNDGTISENRLNQAVGVTLTKKLGM